MQRQILSTADFQLQLLLLLLLLPPFLTSSFTVVVPDSNVKSTLVDTPQSGFSMAHDHARTDPHEQEAVYQIMKATGNSWATSIPDVCRGRWHGIECMPDKDDVYHVVSLSFGALSDDTAFPTCDQRTSFISPALTKLPHIRTLFFYQCFTNNPQSIPAFLGQLRLSLQSLVLRENAHVGPIPSELGNLTLLRVLDLHANNLTASIPHSLFALPSLRSLDLSSNRLTGEIPNLPTTAAELNVLDLSQNLLHGPIPPSIGNCKSLIKMDLSRNYLTGPIPGNFNGGLNSLMLLDLSYNRLSGPLPSSLASLTSLRALILKGPIPESLAQLPSLRVLHLDRNDLNGSIPKSFRHSTQLSELKVNDNRLVGAIPFGRQMLWKLGRKLMLSNNSGLCYDGCSRSHRTEDVDSSSSFVLGIACCDTKAEPVATTTQHLSSSDQQQESRQTRASVAVAHGPWASIFLLSYTAATAHLLL